MTAQEILGNILKAHDLNTLEYKGWLLVDEQLPAMSAATQNLKEYENGASIRLDITLLLGDKKVIYESFAGVGKDELSATQDAFQNFAANSLHVFLSAFWQVDEHEHIGIEEWEIDGEMWKVYIGNFGCKGDYNIPQDLFSTIEEQIKNDTLTEDLNWYRIYYANISKDEKMIESLKNNEDWPLLGNKLKDIHWTASDKFYSLRNFILIKKMDVKDSI
ncbi:DUF6348 family protein [Apibacter sp. HY039]|uniref:DUF6348 family protein n=1 Tax=Apibacter sp. HY039 TaxID=2501476 RepID=UPI000FEC08C3|nr:DUF6348 family protein [Apibacter sp. HY039]